LFFPGDTCIKSAVYCAIHYQHRLPHEVTVIEGSIFPSCKKCGTRVKFQLIAQPKSSANIIPVIADPDFGGTNLIESA